MKTRSKAILTIILVAIAVMLIAIAPYLIGEIDPNYRINPGEKQSGAVAIPP